MLKRLTAKAALVATSAALLGATLTGGTASAATTSPYIGDGYCHTYIPTTYCAGGRVRTRPRFRPEPPHAARVRRFARVDRVYAPIPRTTSRAFCSV